MMQKNLPPLNWSPTGNSGYWFWDENYKQKIMGVFSQGAWRWHDDVHGLMTSNDFKKLRAIASGRSTRKKTFLTRIKNFFKIKKWRTDTR